MLVHGSAHGAWIIPYPRTHLAGSAPGSGRGLSPVHFFVILLNYFVPGTPLWGAGSGMAPCGPNGTPSRRVDRMCIFGREMYRKWGMFALPHCGANQTCPIFVVRPAEAPESTVGPQGPRFALGVGPALPRVPRPPLDHLIRDTRFWETVYEWSIRSLYGGIDCGCARFF